MRVDLGLGDKFILQDKHAQPVSQAAESLQRLALDLFPCDMRQVLELGSGCGIVAIMLAMQRPFWKITGLEIQENLVLLARDNAASCDVDVVFVNEDLRTYRATKPWDIILGNPPWMPKGSGLYSPHPGRNISRFDDICPVKEVLCCVKRNLAASGNALLLYPENRVVEILETAENAGLDTIERHSTVVPDRHVICHLRHKGTRK